MKNSTLATLQCTSQDVDPADFAGEGTGFIIVTSERDGYASWQGYRIQVILAALAISGTPVLTAAINEPYAGFTVSASAGAPPYSFSLSAIGPMGSASILPLAKYPARRPRKAPLPVYRCG